MCYVVYEMDVKMELIQNLKFLRIKALKKNNLIETIVLNHKSGGFSRIIVRQIIVKFDKN